METYLRVTFDSEGAKPSEVAERLLLAGFSPTHGNFDFVYRWNGMASRDQVRELSDEVTRQPKGYKVLFELETV